MAQDKLKKDKGGRNQVPPDSANVPGNEAAYGNPPKHSKSYDESGHLESAERPAKSSGVIKTQKADHGNQYPGRPYPKPSKVETCTPKEKEGKKSIDTQTHSNRHELNAHEEKKVK